MNRSSSITMPFPLNWKRASPYPTKAEDMMTLIVEAPATIVVVRKEPGSFNAFQVIS
ncbi:hypothetical protein D3C87_2029130 [compost metagenome]